MRKGEKLKAFHYASAAVIRDYITTRNIIPNNKTFLVYNCSNFLKVHFNSIIGYNQA